MACREGIINGEAKIEAFLTHLAGDREVSPPTQNQGMNALVFLYKQQILTGLHAWHSKGTCLILGIHPRAYARGPL